MSLLKIGINGSDGSMGKELAALISEQSHAYKLIHKLNSTNSTSTRQELIQAYLECDIILDFSTVEGFEGLINTGILLSNNDVSSHRAHILIGTTGLSTQHITMLRTLAKTHAVLLASNTSLSANLVSFLSSIAAKVLKQYDIEIIDTHHKHKRDNPSGTALMIDQNIAHAKGLNFTKHVVFNRHDSPTTRDIDEISFTSIRAGGIYGEHEVLFASENEVVGISCKALSRKTFAEGGTHCCSMARSARERLLHHVRCAKYRSNDTLLTVNPFLTLDHCAL